MRGKVERRISELERAAAPTSSAPPMWVSVATIEEAERYRHFKGHIYVGVSPDDWDEKNEADAAAPESA